MTPPVATETRPSIVALDAPPVVASPVLGVLPIAAETARLQRIVVLIMTVVPFAGLVIAIWSLWGSGLSGFDLGLMLTTYFLTGIGITVGYHRLFTHRSFEATPAVRAGLAIAGSMAVEGAVITWVADHRRHHAYADKVGDPHSPHLDEGPGLRGVLKGLWHAHLGWIMTPREQSSKERWAPDLLKDPALVRINRLFPLWAVISFVAPAGIGLVVTRSFTGAVTAFVWASLVRIFFLHHVTWSVNSICHFYGRRPYQTDDYSTNNWPLALISFGESWHNNHHAFPSSAVHGLGKAQIDLGAIVISAMERFGGATRVKRVSPKQQLAKRVRTQDA